MKVRELLDKVPSFAFGNEIVYQACAFEKLLQQIDCCREDKTILLKPFYIHQNPVQIYEIYEYELRLIITETQTFENFAQDFFSSYDLDEVEQGCLARLKKCYIGAKKNDDILIPLRQYFDYILRGKGIRSEYLQTFGEYDEDKVYFDYFESETN